MNIKSVKNNIVFYANMSNVITTYQEIASTRMRKIKFSVLKTREFLAGLGSVLATVESYYASYARINKIKKDISIVPRNGKIACVFLSANTGLYGDLIKSVFDMFIQTLAQLNAHPIIVGKMGRLLVENSHLDKYTYFDMSDGILDDLSYGNLVNELLKYEKVVFVHGYFRNVLSQLPKVTNVTGAFDEAHLSGDKDSSTTYNGVISCIFEPSVDKIVMFFETQILSSVTAQTMYESSLSKFAARMINLDSASFNVKKKLSRTLVDFQRIKHDKLNKVQSNLFSSISLWGG